MILEGRLVRLRAVEPEDVERLCVWENDTDVWPVSGTTEPFSREQMARFVRRQLDGGDLLRTGQLRLMIETRPASAAEAPRTVGAIDLFDYDPINRRAGVGILIHAADDRGRGYAADALERLAEYARQALHLHQLWCDVGADNLPSLDLFRRAGFSEAGRKRDWLLTAEGFRDETMWQKILD